MSSVRARDDGRRSRECYRLKWSTVDGVLLTIATTSSCVLVATILVIWNPYTETSSFQPSQCVVISLGLQIDNPRTCFSTSGDSCVFASSSPSSTAVQTPSTPVTNDATLPRKSATRMPGVAGSDVATFRAWIDHLSVNSTVQCRSFPCSRVWVQYGISVNNQLVLGEAQLYANHSDLQRYPGCSYSACDGATYEDNAASIMAALNSWSSRLRLGSTFYCYTNHNNPSVLHDISYTWTQAFHSVFWPAAIGSFCLLALTGHVLYVNVTSWRLNSKTSRDRPAGADEPEPSVHRARTRTRNPMSSSALAYNDNVDFYGMHPTGLTIYEENFTVTVDPPPPYWQLAPLSRQFSENDAVMARRPSTDPPTYRQVADDKTIDVRDDNTITENSEF